MNNLVHRLSVHISAMAPYQRDRYAGQLLIEACKEIVRLRLAIGQALDENSHLADGEACTLIKLKRAME